MEESLMLKTWICIGVAAGFAGLAACAEDSAEQAGERIDSAIEEATQGEKKPGDGPFEKAGEAIDRATGTTSTDALDSLSDAADVEKNTKPD
jgi:hypothetical protein